MSSQQESAQVTTVCTSCDKPVSSHVPLKPHLHKHGAWVECNTCESALWAEKHDPN